MEQFQVDQRKYGRRSLEAEEQQGKGHGDTWPPAALYRH